MKVRIEIDTKTFVRFWLVVIGFGLAGMMMYAAREALMIIGAALFLALALNYPVKKLANIVPGKSRLAGTALAFLSLVLILTTVIWFVVPPLVQQTAKFAESLPALVDQANSQWHGLDEFIDKNGLRPQVNEALENIKRQSSGWAASLGGNIISGVGSVFSFLASAFLVLALAFLMLLEGPSWMERIWGLYRDEERMRHHKKLVAKTYGVVTGYINGQLTVSGIGSLMAGALVFGMSFFVPQVDANLAMPTILFTFILSLIPMFGATLAGALVTLIIAISSVPAGIAYALFFIIYQQIENNLIAPAIQSKKLELSALMVLVAITIGLYVGGMVGGVVAIPIAGTIKVFLDDQLEARRERHQAEDAKPIKKLLKKMSGNS
ncbi:MAG: AI-2E family transporter [Candidatus Saccharibacteria bacterium]|nr:AI-2E family transporter [Candidatus Saccharibacteria bacterium]